MWIPTPLSLVSWICTVKGWVFLQSLVMCAEYFAVAWVLRRIVWNFVAYAFETFLTYNAFKDILNEWIPIIKQWFYFCLGYSIIGFCGAVGAITGFLPILWVYLVYLLVTWGINAYQMYLRVKAILGLEDTIKTACDTVGVFMNLGNCDDLFGKIKEYTYGGAAAVLLLQGTTLLCTGILIRREYLKTGFLFTSMFSSAEEIERRKEKMADRKAGRKEKKAAKHEHALGKEGHAVYEGRMERRRMRAAQEEEGEAIPMKRMEGRQRGLMESSGEEEDLDDTFELPRRSQRLQEESEEELYDPPEGRRRRGGRQARSTSLSLSHQSSLPRYGSEEVSSPSSDSDEKEAREWRRREVGNSAEEERQSSGRRRSRSRGREAGGIV